MKKKKKAKRAWRRAALAGLAAGAYFLFKDNGKLFKQLQASVLSLLNRTTKPGTGLTPVTVPPISRTTSFSSQGRTPSLANGNVVDVVAGSPPPPDSGSNFTVHGEVHGPQH